MKKLFCMFLAAMLLCGLTLSVSATEETHDWADFEIDAGNAMPFLSEDFTTLTIDGETYHRMDISYFENYTLENELFIALTDDQQLQVKNATLATDSKKIIASVSITYRDGSSFSAGFVKDSQRDRLTALLEDENTTAWVEFWNAYSVSATAPIKNFKGKPVQLRDNFLNYCDQFFVYGINYNINIRCILGVVLTHEGKFYYVDAQETGYNPYDSDLWSYDFLDGYEITNEALLTALQENTEEYYSDGVGMLYDDDFTEDMSIGVLVLLFGILPGFVLILAVILLIRSKGYQRKTWAVTAGIAASELAVFGVLVGIFMRLIHP